MSLLSKVLGFLGVTGGPSARCARLYGSCMATTRLEQRELAKAMRQLPDRYADRLRPRTFEHITGDAAAGRWEAAVDRLITALCIQGEPVTVAECDELRAVLDAG